MRIEIVSPDGDLKREVWTFTLSTSWASSCIYFDSYSFQTRESSRHKKWIKQTHWTRFDRRDNNIENPLIPPDVETQMREGFSNKVKELPIEK